MRQDKRVHLLLAEQIDVLALLLDIRHIIDRRFRRLLWFFSFGFFARLYHFRFRHTHILEIFLHRHKFVVQIFEQDKVFHLFLEFLIFQASIFDKRTDVIPVFLIILSVGLTHAAQFVGYFFRDVFRNLCHETVVLKGASGNIQRKVRTVDDSFQ